MPFRYKGSVVSAIPPAMTGGPTGSAKGVWSSDEQMQAKGQNQWPEPSAPPVNTVAPTISGTTTVGQTLSSTQGTWTGTPTPTYAYQWKRNGSNISGATGTTYTLTSSDNGANITLTVTATNVVGSASATSNSLGPVVQAPTNTSAPTISGSNQYVGTTWTSTTGSWQGTSPITYAYQWRRDGSNISGATSSTYTLTATDIGTSITCRVTATNAIGSNAATSSNQTVPQAKPVMVISAYVSSAYRIWAYDFDTATGFGSLYSGSPSFSAASLYMNKTGTVVFVTSYNSPFLAAYAFSSSGWGSKYADPASNPGYYSYDGKLSPAQNTFACAVDNSSSNGLAVYPWNDSTGWGTRYTTPSNNTNGSRCVAWYPTGAYVAKIGAGVNTGIQTYPFSTGGGLSTPIAASSGTFGGDYSAVWSGNGLYMYGSWSSQGYIARYTTWPEGVGVSPTFYSSFYTVVSPGTISGYPAWYNTDRNPSFTYVYAAGYGVTYGSSTLGVWNDLTGYAAPASPTSTAVFGLGFGTNGTTLGFTSSVNPYVGAYAFSGGSGLTTKYAAPSTIPNSVNSCSVAFPRNF